MKVVFAQEVDGDENVVDIAEDEGSFFRIPIFTLHKCYRVISPMATGVQMMRGMVTIVEGVPVALEFRSAYFPPPTRLLRQLFCLTGTSMRVILDR